MVVITSIFVAEIEPAALRNRKMPYEELSLEQQGNVLEESGRELISMYEGKNRVEPME
ncbi:MAG: hypothetical protein JST28_16350 [Acidobacteria bacterium]|nr:hypothetical protein [Acidobacteriota bacterium]